MNAVPPNFPPPSARALPPRSGLGAGPGNGPGNGSGGGAAGSQGANATSMRWAALGDAGNVVAAMAGFAAEQPDMVTRNFPALIRDCPPWRRQLAENAVADLAAIMEPGMAALLAINARGADARPAARALWAEYRAARAAITALLPRAGAMGPLRSA